MGRADIVICPSCDYKRHLTEAESPIFGALVVACLRCGAAMQFNRKGGAVPPSQKQGFFESCTLEALEGWVVS